MKAKEKKYIPKRTFKNVHKEDLYFRNFKGVNKFNPKDNSINFAVKLSEELAAEMDKEGWYVRWTRVPEDVKDRVPIPYLKIAVKMDSLRPPLIKLVSDGVETIIDKTTISLLDAVDIDAMSFRVRPYDWDDTGKYGASAQLERLQILAKADDLDDELNDWLAADDPEEGAPFDIDC